MTLRKLVDIISGTTTDFDRPPYFDEDIQNVRILDDSVNADVNILIQAIQYMQDLTATAVQQDKAIQLLYLTELKATCLKTQQVVLLKLLLQTVPSAGFNFNIDVKDPNKFKVLVDGELVPKNPKTEMLLEVLQVQYKLFIRQ